MLSTLTPEVDEVLLALKYVSVLIDTGINYFHVIYVEPRQIESEEGVVDLLITHLAASEDGINYFGIDVEQTFIASEKRWHATAITLIRDKQETRFDLEKGFYPDNGLCLQDEINQIYAAGLHAIGSFKPELLLRIDYTFFNIFMDYEKADGITYVLIRFTFVDDNDDCVEVLCSVDEGGFTSQWTKIQNLE